MNSSQFQIEVYGDHNISIKFDPNVPCLVFTSGRLPYTDDRMIEGYRKLVQLCSEYGRALPGLGLVADVSESKEVRYDDIEWSVLNIMPKVVKAGVKKLAFVHGDGIQSRMWIDEYMKLTSFTAVPIERKIFGKIEDAKKWLKETLL